jgi:hypothetical protein
MHCYGIANSSPDTVLNLLTRKGFINDASDISVIQVGTTLTQKKPRRKYLFILNQFDLLHNKSVLNSEDYNDVRVFVFASPLRLVELKGVTFLDISPDMKHDSYGFLLRDKIDYKLIRRSKQQPVTKDKCRYVMHLTNAIKEGSLLTPLMTFIYTLPVSTLQIPAKVAACNALFYGKVKYLHDILESITDNPISEHQYTKLVDLLNSDIAKKFQKAFAEYRERKDNGSPTAVKSIATRHKVSDYEMRYIISVLNSTVVKKTKKAKINRKKA